MKKNTSINTLRRQLNYDSFKNTLNKKKDKSKSVQDVTSGHSSPHSWKGGFDEKPSHVDDIEENNTPTSETATKSPYSWRESPDYHSIDDAERISMFTAGSNFKSGTENYPSRNSLVFRRGGDNSIEDAQSVVSLTQLFEYVVLTIVAVVIMLVFGLSGVGFNNVKPACEGDSHAPICDLHITLQKGATQYQVLAAFILGGFVLSSVDQWRQRRSAYSQLCNATRNLILELAAIVPQENFSEKCIMIRWAVLAYELCVLKARNCVDSVDAEDYLRALKLIEEDEWDMLIKGHQNNTAYWWILIKVQNLVDEEKLSLAIINTFAKTITSCRTKGNDLMARNDRDQPRPYCFICAILVNLNLLLTSLSKGLEWAILLYDSKGEIFFEPVMYVEIFVLFTFNAIFAMLFDLCSALYNPFGPRSIDIPHASISKSMRDFAKELSEGNRIPCTMNKHYSRRNSFVLDLEDSKRLEQLEQKLSKSNRVLGRSMLLRPGKMVVMKEQSHHHFGAMSVENFDEIYE